MAAERVVLAQHNMSLAPLGPASWGAGIDALERYGQDAPWMDYEVVPNRRVMESIDAGDERVANMIGSFHTPFFAADGMTGLITKYHKLLPASQTAQLIEYAHRAGNKPTVIYPGTFTDEAKEMAQNYRMPLLVQTEPSFLHKDAAGSHDPDVIMEWLNNEQGIPDPYWCPDTIHAQEGLSPAQAESAWTKMAQSGRVYQAHISINRWESALRRESRREYVALLQSPEAARETRLGQMTLELVQQWQKPDAVPDATLRLVTESPCSTLRARDTQIRMAQNLARLIDQYAQVPVITPQKRAG
jgi:hypothetical protein